MNKLTEPEKTLARLETACTKFLRSGVRASALASGYGERGYSGDAATLYTVVSQGNQENLAWLAWGEFSAPVFETPSKTKYPDSAQRFALLAKQIPLYCVSQQDSYFADEALKQHKAKKPVQYLAEKSIFVAGPQGVFVETNKEVGIGQEKVLVVPYEQALQAIRNLALPHWKEFIPVLKQLPDSPEKARAYLERVDVRKELMNSDKYAYMDDRMGHSYSAYWDFALAMGLAYQGYYTEFSGGAIGLAVPIERYLDLKHLLNVEGYPHFEQEIAPPESPGQREPPGFS